MWGRIASAGIALLILLGSGMAQEPEPVEPQQDEPDPRDVRRSPDDPARSVMDSAMFARRSHFGVALGAFEAYSTNIFRTLEGRQSDSMTLLTPQIFANFGSRRTRFHADYRYGYRFYNRFGSLNTDEHQLNLDYSFALSRRVNFYAYERLDNSINDAYSFNLAGPIFSGGGTPAVSDPLDVLRRRQKLFRNVAALGLGFQITRHGHLSVTGGYLTYRYHIESYANMSAAYASAQYTHQVKRWLNISSSYTTYFTDASSRYRDRQIQRVRVGNFTFQLSRRWEASLGGGVDFTSGGFQRTTRATGAGSASLSHRTTSNAFSLAYNRGLSTYFGQDGVYTVNSGTLAFLQRLSRKASAGARGYYHWGAEYGGGRRLQHYGGSTGLEYALRSDLIASLNYQYRNQRLTGGESSSTKFDRSVVYAGLTYLWPSRQ